MAEKVRYNKISPKFWTDEKVLFWDDDTKLLALYLLTCPHRSTEGLFRLPKPYIAADLQWDMERLRKPFEKLIEDGFIKYDEATSIILLCQALKYQRPENQNQEKNAIKKLKELPETPLMWDLIELAKQYAEQFAKRLVEQFGERYGNPLTLTQTQTLTQTPTQSPTQTPNSNSDSSDDEVVSEWVRLFGYIGPKQVDDLDYWVNELGKSLVLEAIRITAKQRDEKRITGAPFGYMLGILRGWKQKNISSLADLRESEAAASVEPEDQPPEFDEFWAVYPRKTGRRKALMEWQKAIAEGVDPGDLVTAAKHYGQVIRAEETEEKFIKHPANWIRERHYEEYLDPGGGWKTELVEKAEKVVALGEKAPADILAEARWILEGEAG